MSSKVLEKELKTYEENLDSLKAEEGKFVLIKGEDLDVFETYEDAIKTGYQRYGLEPFLVKQIHAIEQVQFVTRLLDTACLT